MDFAYKCFILSALMVCCCLGQNTVSFTMRLNPDYAVQQFTIDKPKVIACEASVTADNQKPTIHWEVNGQTITKDLNNRIRVESRSNGDLMLRIDNVVDGDEGFYKCVATLGTQSDSRTLRAIVIKELVISSPSEQFGIFGADGTIECKASSIPPPSITFKEINGLGIDNDEKHVIQTDSLLIKNLNDQDTRQYLCDIVIIEIGTSRAFIVNFTVVHPPQIGMFPIFKPNNPKEGDPEVQITCQATGIPKPTYQFKRGDVLLPDDKVDEVNGIATLHNLNRFDQGTYTCIATNKGGSQEKSNFLDVTIAPTIDDIPDVTDAVEGGERRVQCTAHADPMPSVAWRKEGSSTVYSDGVRDSGPEVISTGGTDVSEAEIKTVGKTLFFRDITPQDVGTYTCTAVNVVGNATRTMKFEVRYKPTFNTDFKETVFYGWKGHTANLTCLASANDIATIQWFENRDGNEVRIDNESPFTVLTPQVFSEYYLTSSSLMVFVSDDTSPLYKDYICVAKNVMGEARQTVTLRRALPPSAPFIKALTVLSNKITIEIQAPSDNGGQPVLGYEITYFPDTEQSNPARRDVDSTSDATPVELTNLRPKTNYVVKGSARNVAGKSSEVSVSITTKDVSTPLKMDITSQRYGSDPNYIFLTWAEVDDGGAPVTSFIVKYREIRVRDESAQQWQTLDDIDSKYTELSVPGSSARSCKIAGLKEDSFYDVRIIARNSQGDSPEAFQIIKTSKGAGADREGSASLTVNVFGTLLLLILACLSAHW